jgi:hypothetical protein
MGSDVCTQLADDRGVQLDERRLVRCVDRAPKKVKLIATLNPRWIDLAPEILAELVRDVSTLLDMTEGLLLHTRSHEVCPRRHLGIRPA